MFKQLTAAALGLLAACALPLGALAEPSYETYTYTYEGEPQNSPHAYVGGDTIYPVVDELPLSEPGDLYVDADNRIYIADTGNNRVLIFEEDWTPVRALSAFGEGDALSKPQGVFVDKDGWLYVADTGNSRVVVFDETLKPLKTLGKPDSALLGDSFTFNPTALAVDFAKRLYLIIPETNSGILMMGADGRFEGFLGAQKVDANPLDLLWRTFMTEEQIARSVKYVPTNYNNVSLDPRGFVWGTSSTANEAAVLAAIRSRSTASTYAPIRKFNSAGSDILKRNGYFPPYGDVNFTVSGFNPKKGTSSISDVAVAGDVYSALDTKRNRIFTYDLDGNLLYAFGKTGVTEGTAQGLKAIANCGDRILALDKVNLSVLTFEKTDYGRLIDRALRMQADRQYDDILTVWEEIRAANMNFDLAYIGMGRAYYNSGRYEEAMKCFRLVNDVQSYSAAYKEYRALRMENWLPLLILAAAAAVAGLILFFRFARRYNKAHTFGKRNNRLPEKLMFAFHVVFRPFDGFSDLKREKRGSVGAATCLLALTILTFIGRSLLSGYIFSAGQVDLAGYDLLADIYAVLLPFLLWCIANWCLTSLMDGEGSFRDIYIATGYALTPLILIHIPVIFLSNFVTADEVSLLTMAMSFGFIWCGVLLFCSMAVIHDYGFLKNLVTCLLTVVGMGILMFIALLFMNVIGRMVGFVGGLAEEIMLRL